jgi:hypothetical protein
MTVSCHLLLQDRFSCDINLGAGIVTNHAAFTLEAERSLQAINPALSMPYWEYPMDAYLYTDDNWSESPLFSESWFGEASPSNSLHELKSSPWAEIRIAKSEDVVEAAGRPAISLKVPNAGDEQSFVL